METTYSIKIRRDGKFQVTADYGLGARCEAFCNSFSDAVELVEDWYKGDTAENV